MMALMMMQKMKMMMNQQSPGMILNPAAGYEGNFNPVQEKAKNQCIVDVDNTEDTGNSTLTNTGNHNCLNHMANHNWQSSMPSFLQAQMPSMVAGFQLNHPQMYPDCQIPNSQIIPTSTKQLHLPPDIFLANQDQEEGHKNIESQLSPPIIDIIDVDSPKKLSSHSESRPTSTGKSTLATTADKSQTMAGNAN